MKEDQLEELANALWAAGQLGPDEVVVDGVERIMEILKTKEIK